MVQTEDCLTSVKCTELLQKSTSFRGLLNAFRKTVFTPTFIAQKLNPYHPVTIPQYHPFPSWARMHHKVVGNFGSEADVRSLYYRRFRFIETSDVGACTHDQLAK